MPIVRFELCLGPNILAVRPGSLQRNRQHVNRRRAIGWPSAQDGLGHSALKFLSRIMRPKSSYCFRRRVANSVPQTPPDKLSAGTEPMPEMKRSIAANRTLALDYLCNSICWHLDLPRKLRRRHRKLLELVGKNFARM